MCFYKLFIHLMWFVHTVTHSDYILSVWCHVSLKSLVYGEMHRHVFFTHDHILFTYSHDYKVQNFMWNVCKYPPPPIRAPISAPKPLFLPYHILHFFSLSHSHTLISVGLSHLLQIFWVRCELVREERCKQGELLHKDHCCFKKKKKLL